MNDLLLGPGDLVGEYVVEDELGRGSCAIVFQVQHRKHGTRHAMKLLVWSNASLRQRLAREGQMQSQLRHPNIVPVQDVFEHGGRLLLIAELIEGPTLEDWLQQHRPTRAETERVFRDIVTGVAAAHAAGVIHRDLKPGNVLLQPGPDGGWIPRITDFGIARHLDQNATLTRPGVAVGTPGYMAPEQFDDASRVDTRADVFSLGCVLYEMLTGRPLFQGNMATMELATRAGRYPLPSDLPPALTNVLSGCLEIDPTARIRDGAGVLRVLDGSEPDEETGAAPLPRARRRKPPSEMSPVFAAFMGGLTGTVLSVCILFAVAGFGLDRSATQDRAEWIVAGEVESVWLLQGDHRYAPGAVPPGEYSIVAHFEGSDPIQTGEVALRAGQTVRLDCDAVGLECRLTEPRRAEDRRGRGTP